MKYHSLDLKILAKHEDHFLPFITKYLHVRDYPKTKINAMFRNISKLPGRMIFRYPVKWLQANPVAKFPAGINSFIQLSSSEKDRYS